MYTKDSRTETFLTQMGVDYNYTNSARYEDLFPGWKERNPSRPVAIREEAVLDYACLMESGSAAPAPILHKAAKWFQILDGVQRLAAGELRKYQTFSAYVVSSDNEDVLMAIRMLANLRLQGHAESPDWTRRQAVEALVIQRKMPPAEVAAMGGWREADVIRLAHVLDWGFRLRCLGGPILPDTLVSTIAQHATEDHLHRAGKEVAEFLHVLKQARFSNEDAAPLVARFFEPVHKDANLQKSYRRRLTEIVETAEVQIRLHGRRGPSYELHVELARRLKGAKTVADEILTTKADVPYVDEFFRLLNTIRDAIRKMASKHPAPQTASTPADMWSTDAPN